MGYRMTATIPLLGALHLTELSDVLHSYPSSGLHQNSKLEAASEA